MRRHTVAKAAVFDLQGRVLLLRRSGTDLQRPNEWDFPGGNIEEGEALERGLIREVQEEAGLQIFPQELQLLYTATTAYEETGKSVTRLLFAARVSTEQSVSLSFEHSEAKWINVETALAEFNHPFYGTGLRYALDHQLL